MQHAATASKYPARLGIMAFLMVMMDGRLIINGQNTERCVGQTAEGCVVQTSLYYSTGCGNARERCVNDYRYVPVRAFHPNFSKLILSFGEMSEAGVNWQNEDCEVFTINEGINT